VLSLLVVIFILYGCGAATSDPFLRRRAANVVMISSESPIEMKNKKFVIIDEIMGKSCGEKTGSDPSVEAALQMLKIEAGKLYADAVIDFICEEVSSSWGNCSKAIECRGDAITWKDR